MGVAIRGTGSALPEKVLTNQDLEKMVDTTDEWIRQRTGMRERHIAGKETVPSMAAEACRRALESAGKRAEDTELIIVATCTTEMLLPCAACRVQKMLGADKAIAFDINAACGGFLFALNTAHHYIESGACRNALVVGSEVLSEIIDWTDRSTCVLFGDGAGAVYVEETTAGEKSGIIGMSQGSSGMNGQMLYCRGRAVKGETEPEINSEDLLVHMSGSEVYRFAVRQVPVCIGKALDSAGIGTDEVDIFVLHQANSRIIESIARTLKTDIERFPMNIERTGNTSSASIPILLDELNRAGKIQKGQKVVLSGFGAGMTYGACVVVW
ncbi:MAG: ketoacyl-ACP synthase III [Lachnospiraceae bacterium]|nr:ketoacyl-ACP synthase III [Lachnospiraceae bacterium]